MFCLNRLKTHVFFLQKITFEHIWTILLLNRVALTFPNHGLSNSAQCQHVWYCKYTSTLERLSILKGFLYTYTLLISYSHIIKTSHTKNIICLLLDMQARRRGVQGVHAPQNLLKGPLLASKLAKNWVFVIGIRGRGSKVYFWVKK